MRLRADSCLIDILVMLARPVHPQLLTPAADLGLEGGERESA